MLTAFEYQYPLKLISPDPHSVKANLVYSDGDDSQPFNVPITTVFLLTYGGGLLAGDTIDLTVTLDQNTRLALLTQGSTKIFKTDNKASSAPPTFINSHQSTKPTSQTLNVKLSAHSALCYLPDPNQPYASSIYEQRQTFYVDPYGSSSLLFLDWVTEGRSARGEKWTLSSWKGRNEVREFDETSKGRLLLRDSLLLFGDDLTSKTDGKGVLGTLVIYGPLFEKLGKFFMKEFQTLPRIGAKNWTPGPKTPTIVEQKENNYFESGSASSVSATQNLSSRVEEVEGLLWTAAQARGFVLVKFSAREVDGARRWLGQMLKKEGSVERAFGHQALLCVRP